MVSIILRLGISNSLIMQWTDAGSHPNASDYTVNFPITLSYVSCVLCCPHTNMWNQIYWADFGYNITTSSVNFRCINYQDVLILGY